MGKWNFNSIPDQQGRIALVTGANSGIGYQTALMLAEKGAEVILACRNTDKAEQAADTIRKEFRAAKLSTVKLDLSDLDSVLQCADSIKSKYNKLDLLINNAGVMVPPLTRTKQGFELQFGTNHLGHFALTGKLLPLILQTAGSRIVSVSSVAASINYIDLNDPNYNNKRYRKWFAYGQSKLAELMFIEALAERLNKKGSPTIATAAHPGGASTNLQQTTGFFMRKILTPMISHSPAEAALPTLRAACDPSASNCSYWGPSGFTRMTGAPEPAKIPSKALNADLCNKLWEISEKLTGVAFDL